MFKIIYLLSIWITVLAKLTATPTITAVPSTTYVYKTTTILVPTITYVPVIPVTITPKPLEVKINNTNVNHDKPTYKPTITSTSTTTTKNISHNQEVIPDEKKNNKKLKSKSYTSLYIILGLIIFVPIGVYYKFKKIYKPKTFVDPKPEIIVNTRLSYNNVYDRGDETCYRRLSGSNSPV
jgi:hypothetical protein